MAILSYVFLSSVCVQELKNTYYTSTLYQVRAGNRLVTDSAQQATALSYFTMRANETTPLTASEHHAVPAATVPLTPPTVVMPTGRAGDTSSTGGFAKLRAAAGNRKSMRAYTEVANARKPTHSNTVSRA